MLKVSHLRFSSWRYPSNHKLATRRRIVAAASAAFRERGPWKGRASTRSCGGAGLTPRGIFICAFQRQRPNSWRRRARRHSMPRWKIWGRIAALADFGQARTFVDRELSIRPATPRQSRLGLSGGSPVGRRHGVGFDGGGANGLRRGVFARHLDRLCRGAPPRGAIRRKISISSRT